MGVRGIDVYIYDVTGWVYNGYMFNESVNCVRFFNVMAGR